MPIVGEFENLYPSLTLCQLAFQVLVIPLAPAEQRNSGSGPYPQMPMNSQGRSPQSEELLQCDKAPLGGRREPLPPQVLLEVSGPSRVSLAQEAQPLDLEGPVRSACRAPVPETASWPLLLGSAGRTVLGPGTSLLHVPLRWSSLSSQ